MTRIRLQLLGGFSVESVDGKAIVPLPRKARALIAFLALADPPMQPRQRLAGVFWSDHGESQSRTSLRQALTVVRKQIGDVLISDHETVGFVPGSVAVGVAEFVALATSAAMPEQTRAIDLYRGDLLDGFQSDTSVFDEWMATTRERLRRQVIDTVTRVLAHHESSGNAARAVMLAGRLVALDPLHEEAHRGLMRAFNRLGRPALALKQYRTLRHALRRELGVSPEPATEILVRKIAEARRSGSCDAADPATASLAGDAEVFESDSHPTPHDGSPRQDDDRHPALLSHAAERRQLTVLSCELVEFNELAARLDPEDLWEIVQTYEAACTRCIARFDGTLHQRRGDSTIAFFGFPVAHEDECRRAIHAGLAIVEAVSRLNYSAAGALTARVGIAAGMVVVSSMDKGVIGAAVNLADQLQAVAPPGSVLVSEAVRRLAGGVFDYWDLGELSLRGIGIPVHVQEVRGADHGSGSRFEAATLGRLTPLVGREQELGLLLDRWALAREGDGQVVLLSGEPGIGKSRILTTLPERLEVQGVQALRFQCSPYHVNSALWPSIDNFERTLQFVCDESPDARLDKLEALVVGHYHRPISDVRYIASLLSIPSAARYGEIAATPQKQKDETFRVLVDLTEAAARRQPSVVLFEDIQWADPTTLEVLDLLIDRVRSFPLLIVLTHRPEFQSRWGTHGHVTNLSLSKLTRLQSRALVCGVASGKSLPEDLLNQIVGKTDGIPLFVEELTKSVLESGHLILVGDRYESARTQQDFSIPATLRDSLVARLDRLGPVKEIAQIGAVIGREFRYELIAEVVALPPSSLAGGLQRLVDAGLVFRRRTSPNATYVFKHALLQDAAYDSLLKSRRQELHASVAKAIEERLPDMRDTEPELLAHHLTAAGLAAAAIPFWRQAAANAMERVALLDAQAHCDHGIGLLAAIVDPRDRARQELSLQLILGQSSALSKGWSAPEPGRAFSRARALCEHVGDAPEVFPALWGVWAFLDVAGRMSEAHSVALEFLAHAQRMGDRAAQCEGHRIVGEMAYRLGDQTRARFHLERGIDIYDAVAHRGNVTLYGQDSGLTNLVYLAWVLWLLGYPDQARRAQQRAIDMAASGGQPFGVAWAHVFDAYLQTNLRNWPAADVAASIVVTVCSEHGFGFWHAFGSCYLGLARLHGPADTADGDAVLKQIDILRSFGSGVSLTAIHAAFADGLLALGRIDEGLQQVAAGLDMVAKTGECFAEAELYQLRGALLLPRSPAAAPEAESCLIHALEIACRHHIKSVELRTATQLARLRMHQGRSDEACQLLAPAYGWFTEGFDTADLVQAKALLDELATAGTDACESPTGQGRQAK